MGEAYMTVVYLINRLPTTSLDNKSPLEVLVKQIPNYNTLKFFGSACYPNLRPYNRHKMEFRSMECNFLGYRLNHKGYKCVDKSKRIYISRDVVFNEEHFPFKTQVTSTGNNLHKSSSLSNSLIVLQR